jgi:hypothetical protein
LTSVPVILEADVAHFKEATFIKIKTPRAHPPIIQQVSGILKLIIFVCVFCNKLRFKKIGNNLYNRKIPGSKGTVSNPPNF